MQSPTLNLFRPMFRHLWRDARCGVALASYWLAVLPTARRALSGRNGSVLRCFLPVLLLLAPGISTHAQTPLPDWEQLSAEQREQLITPLRDRWNSATPEQRTRMHARAERWQQMGAEERARISGTIGRWQDLPPGHHHEVRAVFHHLRTLDESGRAAFLAHWKTMTAEQRQAWALAHPAPQREGPPRRSRNHPQAP